MKICGSLLTLFVSLASASGEAPFKDSRDGKTYRTVRAGGHLWMAQNLAHAAKGATCYENDASACERAGRLYTWTAAQKACPEGWELPTKAAWDALAAGFGGESAAGTALKASSGWSSGAGRSSTAGFNALPTGYRLADGTYHDQATAACWWTSNDKTSSQAWNASVAAEHGRLDFWDGAEKANGNSVRCIRKESKASQVARPERSLKDAFLLTTTVLSEDELLNAGLLRSNGERAIRRKVNGTVSQTQCAQDGNAGYCIYAEGNGKDAVNSPEPALLIREHVDAPWVLPTEDEYKAAPDHDRAWVEAMTNSKKTGKTAKAQGSPSNAPATPKASAPKPAAKPSAPAVKIK